MEYPFKSLMPLDEATARTGYYKDWTHIDADAFHQISELVKFIREKGYGADVREVIAQAFERIYHDASIEGNANMEMSASRGSFETLVLRLASMDSKISSTMTQAEFDSWVATLLDGGPSIFMDSLAMLHSTYPNGASGVALVRETDPAKIYVWDGSVWKDFGEYQGIEVKDGAITEEKLAPSLTYDPGINLLNPKEIDRINKGYYLAVDGTFIAGAYYTTPLIAIKPNTIYTKDPSPFTGNSITYWAADGSFLSGKDIGAGPNADTSRFVTPNNAAFVRYPLIDADFDDSMLVEANYMPGGRIPYGAKDLLVTRDIKELMSRTINLVDFEGISRLGFFSVTGDFIYNNEYKTTGLIPVKENTWYSKSITSNVTFFDSNHKFVIGYDSDKLFKVPGGKSIKYARSSMPADMVDFMIVEGFRLPANFVKYGDTTSILAPTIKDVSGIKRAIELEKARNVLILKDIETGYYHDYTTGDEVRYRSAATTGMILARSGDVFTRSKETLAFNHATFWSNDDTFITGIDLKSSTSITVPQNSDIAKMKVALPIESIDENLMLIRGDDYPDYKYLLDDEFKVMRQDSNKYIKPFGKVSNPVITTDIVTDRTEALGVADPFIVNDKGRFHMFFEILQGLNPHTSEKADEIGHAYSDDLINWTYTQVVLSKEEHGHRSAFPNVFKVDGEWYMLPDVTGNVKLYKATVFPSQWEFVSDLIVGNFADTNVFKMDEVWYMLTTGGLLGWNGISLYYNISSDWKNDQWKMHPAGLIIPNSESEGGKRCGGNPVLKNGYLYQPVQITPATTGFYGEYTRLYKISGINKTEANATDLGIIMGATKDGEWTSTSMHHITHSEYIKGRIFAVDGTRGAIDYAIGLYVEG